MDQGMEHCVRTDLAGGLAGVWPDRVAGSGGVCPQRTPLVSVIAPNHDYGRFLPRCLDSVLAQGLDPARLEFILADDASADGSVDTALELLGPSPLGAWTVLALPRVGRPGPVRNAGLRLARGEYLLTLDPDDELLPEFLAESLDALARSGAGVAYTDYLEGREGEPDRVVRLRPFHKLMLANQNLLASAALFRRGFWDAGARFRRATAYEDWDFWIQLAALGADFVHVPRPLFRYRLHADSFSGRARADDSLSKARLVLANPGFFPSWTVAWARRVAGGDLSADALGRGLIPILPEQAGRRLPL